MGGRGMSKLDSPDSELIKLCIKALGAQAAAACCTANDTPKGVSDDLMAALNDRVYAAIEPLAAMQATTEVGYVVLQSCATNYATDEDGKCLYREEAVALSALRDLAEAAA
jgi:hypothetical protein